MSPFKSAYTEHQLKRWMRPDAHHFIRPDWRRHVKPGSELWSVYEVYEREYSADQPRVPAGVSEGGQWTSDGGAGGGSSSPGTGSEPTAGSGRSDPRVLSDATPYNYYKPGAQLAENEPQKQHSVNLAEEELRGGHTLRDHVGKTDEELMAVMRTDRGDVGIGGYMRQRQGTFESQESANDFVNRTLEQNKTRVDQVASGNEDGDFVKARFGYITGREAYRPNPNAEAYLRDTYGVGVGIRHDPSSARGYRVFTAYPRND